MVIAPSVPASQFGRHFARFDDAPLKSSRKTSFEAGGVVVVVVVEAAVGAGVVVLDGASEVGLVVGAFDVGGLPSVLTRSTGRFASLCDSEVATLTWVRTPSLGAGRSRRNLSVSVPGRFIFRTMRDTSKATRPRTGAKMTSRVSARLCAALMLEALTAVARLVAPSTTTLCAPRWATRHTRIDTLAVPPLCIAAIASEETVNGMKRRRSSPSAGISPIESDRLLAP